MDRVLTALEHFQSLQNATVAGATASNMPGESSTRDLLLGDGKGGNLKKGDSKDDKGFDPAKMRKELEAWFEKLNYTEKVKIHIARAFIMNPEVLVMHRPLYHFSDEVGKQVLGMIKQHHKNRGMCMPLTTLGRRRPRTVFMTTDTDWEEQGADVVWRIDSEKAALVEEKPTVTTDPTANLTAARKAIEESKTPRNGGDSSFRESSGLSDQHHNTWGSSVSEWCFNPSKRNQLPHEQ